MLDKSICHFRGARSILPRLFYFGLKILLANNVDADQMPHYVASDLGLQCLPMIFFGFKVRMGYAIIFSFLNKTNLVTPH